MKNPPVTRGPLSPIWAAWDSSVPRRPPKNKDAPVFTEQRGLNRWDALDPADRDEIHAAAVEAAARIMREFEMRRGQR